MQITRGASRHARRTARAPYFPCAGATRAATAARRITEHHGPLAELRPISKPRHETPTDPSLALLFRRDSTADPLVPLATMEHPRKRAQGEPSGRRPPRPRSHLQQQRGPPLRAAQRRAPQGAPAVRARNRAATGCGAGSRGVNALWFFASSPFLGELKARLSDAVDKACNARSIATSLPSASPRSSSGCSIHGCEGREALFRAGTCALDKPQGENRVGFLDWLAITRPNPLKEPPCTNVSSCR